MENNDDIKKKYPNSKNLLYWGIGILVLTTILLSFAPVIVTKCHIISLEVDDPNEIGDTIGGILGPLVGLIGVALTFLAFWAQYDANIQQRKEFETSLENERKAREREETKASEELEQKNKDIKEQQERFLKTQELQQNQILLQDKRARITVFETRFHTMLAIHRDNANQMEVNKISGRKVFIHMLDELKSMHKIFKGILVENGHNNAITEEELYNIAYLSFFFGIGDKSTPMVKDLAGERLSKYVTMFHDRLETYQNQKKNNPAALLKIGVNEYEPGKLYTFGVGHLRRLGHYIRHLFQTVKFVDDQPTAILSHDDKYNYVSSLRAQLSAHEQILLFYNALSVMGKPWLDTLPSGSDNYIERYCLLKSIPINAADFYKKPLEVFAENNSDGRPMFEWNEIKSRMALLDASHT
ncbi:MAG: hypothetical protein DI539_09835 [Flavobacterium psychrophilum]|nr:MAG: hypothetical protein DI539_09835 [Flavobacterium psychrophilum]